MWEATDPYFSHCAPPPYLSLPLSPSPLSLPPLPLALSKNNLKKERSSCLSWRIVPLREFLSKCLSMNRVFSLHLKPAPWWCRRNPCLFLKYFSKYRKAALSCPHGPWPPKTFVSQGQRDHILWWRWTEMPAANGSTREWMGGWDLEDGS